MTQPTGKPSYWRSALFSLGMIAATCLWAPLVLLTFPFPYAKRYGFAVLWCRMILFWLKLTCKIEHHVSGLENIPDRTVVVLSKHQSTWETLTLARLFAPQVWVLKRELLLIPFFGWGLAMLRPIAIDRQARRAAMRQVITQGTSRLNAGCNVVVFPEGTRVQVGKRKRYGLGGNPPGSEIRMSDRTRSSQRRSFLASPRLPEAPGYYPTRHRQTSRLHPAQCR